MSQHVLARKWRPQFFADLAGQEHVVKALTNALEKQRLHHAYLFSGTRGVGKTTLGRILARCLNCEQGISATPCGECSSCTEIAQGRSLDLIEVDAASRTKVDDTRELLENVQFAPTQSRYKIYLIDEVHMLSNSSFNALLKTIEEPPEHVVFIFATTHPQKIPPTVLSRCLQFHLKNMTVAQIAEHLSSVLQQEAIEAEPEALNQIGKAAAGSMRDALSLTDQAIAFGGGSIGRQQVQDMLGVIDATLLFDLLDSFFNGNAERALQLLRDYASQAVDFGLLLDELLSVLHGIAVEQVAPGSRQSEPDYETILRFAQSIAPEDIQLCYQTILNNKRDFPLAPDPLTGLEMIALRVIAFRKMLDSELETLAVTASAQQISGSTEPSAETLTAKKPDAAQEGCAEQPGNRNTSVAAEPSAYEEPSVCEKPLAGKEPSASKEPSAGRAPLADIEPSIQKNAASEEKPVNQQSQSAADTGLSRSEGALAEPPSLNALTPALWCSIFSSLPLAGVVRAVASGCILLKVDGDCLHFALLEESAALYKPESAERLATSLSLYFGQPVRCNISVVANWPDAGIQLVEGEVETPADYRARVTAIRHEKALASLKDDENVRALVDAFDATLDEHSIEFIEPDGESASSG